MGCIITFVYPNLVRLYGYSSRNQRDEDAYVNLLSMRMKAKKGQLTDDFLKPLGLTNDDLKIGLKLPLNAYTGGLRAKFNDLYDNLQGFSICTTGQLFILQLIYDLKTVPTLETISCNTDAILYEVDEEYKEQAHKVLDDWQKLTGLELEEDKIVKIIMVNVNNYVEIVQTGDNDYKVNYKGGNFTGKHIFTWDKEKHIFYYEFKDDLKSNSMTIVSEAILKKLLFDIPTEETINKCDDIFRFQIISHLGSTYEKCVQESPNGDIELQRNNRIYAGKIPSGAIIKVKPDGRRDSLANQPPNPIVDNANQCTIDDINKEWYIDLANKRVNDFLGIKRIEEYSKEELITIATNLGLLVDKSTKKEELIKIIENNKKNIDYYDILCYNNNIQKGEKDMAIKQELEQKLQTSMEQNEKLMDMVNKMKGESKKVEEVKEYDERTMKVMLLRKLNEFRNRVRERKFILDKELPKNLGGGDYYSIDQFYDAIQELAIEVGLDFSFETTDLIQFDKELTKPANSLPIHVATVKTVATFTDLETGACKEYITIAQGSDTIDKAVASASSMAFRNWFYKNFTPKDVLEEEIEEPEEKSKPKVPVYVPEKKKEEIKKDVVKQVQQEPSDEEDIKAVCENIMKIRELTDNQEYGTPTLNKLMSGTLSSADILEIDLKVKKKLKEVENNG